MTMRQVARMLAVMILRMDSWTEVVMLEPNLAETSGIAAVVVAACPCASLIA